MVYNSHSKLINDRGGRILLQYAERVMLTNANILCKEASKSKNKKKKEKTNRKKISLSLSLALKNHRKSVQCKLFACFVFGWKMSFRTTYTKFKSSIKNITEYLRKYRSWRCERKREIERKKRKIARRAGEASERLDYYWKWNEIK